MMAFTPVIVGIIRENTTKIVSRLNDTQSDALTYLDHESS